MNLFEYLPEKKIQLSNFSRYWQLNNQAEPDNYPMDLDYSEFDEQFDFFVENQERNNNGQEAI